MLIIAHHNISDPEGFWSAAERTTNNVPADLKLIAVYPSQDGKTGTCLWEAGEVQEVQDFLDQTASQYAENFCYEVNLAQSVGLPTLETAASLS